MYISKTHWEEVSLQLLRHVIFPSLPDQSQIVCNGQFLDDYPRQSNIFNYTKFKLETSDYIPR